MTPNITQQSNNSTTQPLNGVAISVKNISKSYRMYPSPKEKLKELLHPFGKKYHKEFWALRDINIEIPKGKTYGIIGQNGSGKSTLLQLICGVLQPTFGSVKVNGRISALLELGAGFNKKFTGRENVFMQGAMMGISREEMKERFDKIAEFADIGHFIEQPARTYSSGMYVRLAFATAINVDPEILIVDEALAVGDIKFQRKCYAKFGEFRDQGKTILFVTHSLDTVNQFCDAAILINKGSLKTQGEPKHITRLYQKMMLGEDVQEIESKKKGSEPGQSEEKANEDLIRVKSMAAEKLQTGNSGKKAEIIDYGILNSEGGKVTLLETGQKYTFYSRALIYEPLNVVHLGYPIKTLKDLHLFGINNEVQKISVRPQARGDILEGRVDVTMWLAPGHYFVSFRAGAWVGDWEEMYDEVADMHFVVATDIGVSAGSIVNLEARLNVHNV